MKQGVLICFLLFTETQNLRSQTVPSVSESIEVNVINVEAIVTDRQGRRITGLTAADFIVYEGRQKRTISNFSEYRRHDVPREPGLRLEPVERQPRTVLLILDHGFLPPRQHEPLVTSIRKLLEAALGPGDQASIVTLSPRLEVHLPLTADRDQIISSLLSIERALTMRLPDRDGFAEGQFYEQFFEEIADFWRSVGINAPPPSALYGAERAAWQIVGTKRRALALRSLFDRYGTIEGKKIALLVSSFFQPGPHRAHMDNTYELIESIGRSASMNGLTLYALHPEGMKTSFPDASRASSPRAGEDPHGYELTLKHLEALRLMSEPSGGASFYGPGQLLDASTAVLEDLDSYYSIGFLRERGQRDQERPIRLEVRDRSLRVRWRRIVVDRSTHALVRNRLLANLFDRVSRGDLDVELSVNPARRDGRGWLVPIQIRFRGGRLVRRAGYSSEKGLFSVFVAAADRRGGVSPILHHQQPVTFVPSSKPDDLMTTYEITLRMRPGAHVLSVAVLDEFGPQAGYARSIVAVGGHP